MALLGLVLACPTNNPDNWFSLHTENMCILMHKKCWRNDWSRYRNGAAIRGLVPRCWCPHHGTAKGKNTTWFHCTSCGMRQVSGNTSHWLSLSDIYSIITLSSSENLVSDFTLSAEKWLFLRYYATLLVKENSRHFFNQSTLRHKKKIVSLSHFFPRHASAACILHEF